MLITFHFRMVFDLILNLFGLCQINTHMQKWCIDSAVWVCFCCNCCRVFLANSYFNIFNKIFSLMPSSNLNLILQVKLAHTHLLQSHFERFPAFWFLALNIYETISMRWLFISSQQIIIFSSNIWCIVSSSMYICIMRE